MDKTVKNVLAAVGAVAVVKTAPVLAVGAAIGAYVADPQKANKAVMNGIDKTMNFAEDMLVKAGVSKEELERTKQRIFEKEPETIEDLISEDESEVHFECESTPAEDVEPEPWEEEVLPEEEQETPIAEEPAPEHSVTEAEKLENLRAKGMEFISALKELAEDSLK